MKNIFAIFKRDLKKIFTNSMAIILVVGVAILPSLYAWFNIYSNWDPYGSTGNMKVAVINEDEGTSFKDLTIDVGDEIVGNLKANDSIDWQFVSKKEALSGVKSGKYYAAIEIPKGFSKSLSSIITPDFKQPQITYYANEKKNAIATKITDKVVQTVQTEVNESFVITVVDMVNIIMGTAVDTGLATGTNVLETIQSEITSAKQSVKAIQTSLDSFNGIMDIANDLGSSVNTDDLDTLLTNADKLVKDTDGIIKISKESVNKITASLGTFLSEAEESINTSASLVELYGGKTDQKSKEVINKVIAQDKKVKEQIDKISSALSEINKALPIKIKKIDSTVEKLNKISTDFAKVIDRLEKLSKNDIKVSAKAIADDMTELSSKLSSVENDYKNNIQPLLSDNVNQLITTLADASVLINNMDSKLEDVNTLAETMSKSLSTGNGMISSLDSLLTDCTTQLDKLSKKIDGIEKSEIVNTLVNLTDGSTDELGEFLACPVKVKTDKVYGIENYGSAMAPFYSTLAIWVGGMFLIALIKTDVKKKSDFHNLKPHQEYFGRGILFVCLAIVQGLIICLGDLYFLKIQCYDPGKFIFAGITASIIYTVFIYSLVYCFGDIGKALAVIMLVIQIGGSGGTFPIDVTPPLFRALNPYLPFTFVIEAMRETICGTYENDYWIYLLKLCAYLLAGLITGLFVRFIVKKPIKFFTKRVEETGLF